MTKSVHTALLGSTCVAGLALISAQAPPPQQPGPPPSQSEISVSITGDIGAPLHYAVPEFIALTQDKETAEAARLITEEVGNDLAFEREYDMIPRETYKTSFPRFRDLRLPMFRP